ASVISRASLARLTEELESEPIDVRRFRMLVEIDGVEAHGEDRWVGSRVRIGSALVAMHGHVGRCMITTRHPDTGVVDLKTLHALASYRRDLDSTEPLPFGVYGEVLEGGAVSIGDPVSIDGQA
ncbi:MAG: MOSC domain-containing protein, partial [Solirubrobacteraceae bacterium]